MTPFSFGREESERGRNVLLFLCTTQSDGGRRHTHTSEIKHIFVMASSGCCVRLSVEQLMSSENFNKNVETFTRSVSFHDMAQEWSVFVVVVDVVAVIARSHTQRTQAQYCNWRIFPNFLYVCSCPIVRATGIYCTLWIHTNFFKCPQTSGDAYIYCLRHIFSRRPRSDHSSP